MNELSRAACTPQANSPNRLAVVACSFFVCWLTFITYYVVKFDIDGPPSTSGDEVDYDSIGWELSQGNGFRVDTGDPKFRRPYELAAQEAERFELGPVREHLDTTRPPGFPVLISLLNRLFGRQFWATRVMNAACLAGALACTTLLLSRHVGWPGVALCIFLFVAVDVRTRLYGRAILTEALSLFSTSLLMIALVHLNNVKEFSRNNRMLILAGVGVLYGVSILIRTLMILWFPGLLLMVYWILIRQSNRSIRECTVALLMFSLGTVTILLPWCVRNVAVTGAFMPLGTQGQVQLAAAWSDEIWEARGLWINMDQQGAFDAVLDPQLTQVEQELVKAAHAKRLAWDWITAHPIRSVLLFPIKIWQECRPRQWTEWGIGVLAVWGAIVLRRRFLGQLLLAVLATNLFAIGITWSVEGRFLVPVLLPIHVFAAVGGYWLGCTMMSLVRRHSPDGATTQHE